MQKVRVKPNPLRYGRLVVLDTDAGRNAHSGGRLFRCLCDCGNVRIVRADRLRSGRTKSCGCYSRDCRTIHGHGVPGARSLTYMSWNAMIRRCCNPKYTDYNRYGGAGITICERWRTFANFLADMGPRPEGTSLDRYPDRAGNYEPGNCRWATRREQGNNTSSNVRYSHGGLNLTIAELAREVGLSYDILQRRLRKYNWPLERALYEPVRECIRHEPSHH